MSIFDWPHLKFNPTSILKGIFLYLEFLNPKYRSYDSEAEGTLPLNYPFNHK